MMTINFRTHGFMSVFHCLAFVLLSACGPNLWAVESTTLQYQPEKNLHYIVDRTLTLLERHKNNETKTLKERAVLSFGKPRVVMSDRISVDPRLTLISIAGDMNRHDVARLHYLEPVARKFPTGELTKFADGDSAPGRPWDVHLLFRTFEPFPIFPQSPVTVQEPWIVKMDMRFYGQSGFVTPVRVEHVLTGHQTVSGRRCARIEYTFSGSLDTANSPEMLAGKPVQILTKPKYGITGQGVVDFDPEAGIVVKKEQSVKWTRKWSGRLDDDMIRKHSGWANDVDEVTECSIVASLLAEDDALRLIAESGSSKPPPVTSNAIQPPIPTWTYSVERVVKDIGGTQVPKRSSQDLAKVTYYKDEGPQVVYVDNRGLALPVQAASGVNFQPMHAHKISLLTNVPPFGSATGWPVEIIANAFDILPIHPDNSLKRDMKWTNQMAITFGGSPRVETIATIEHFSAPGLETKQGRQCLRIDYTIEGSCGVDEKEYKADHTLSGSGSAHVAVDEAVLVTKTQQLVWTSSVQVFDGEKDEDAGWGRKYTDQHAVELRVSLPPRRE